MKPRTKLLTGLLASILILGTGSLAAADPPPWAGRWHKHSRDCDHGDARRYSTPRYSSLSQCGAITQRIEHDRGLIRQWQGTGRHEKVVSWARGDLRNAYRDLDRCRRDPNYDYPYDNVKWPPRDDRFYDGGYYEPRDDYRYDRYDPYPLSADRSFNLKSDWPYLLGAMLNANAGLGR